MASEIERKYLVNHQIWSTVKPKNGVLIVQGYLVNDSQKSVRIRIAGDRGFLTIKGGLEGNLRQEFEYNIPVEDAKILLDQFSESSISKIRYKLSYGDRVIEVDEFLGDNEGLIIAEIELYAVEEQPELPNWITEEVTYDKRYYNVYLTNFPYKSWEINKIRSTN